MQKGAVTMADYKTCVKHDMDICPMARRFANDPKVTLDCSKCKDYRSTEKKCGDCKHYDARDAYCGAKHESRLFREKSAACYYYEERNEEKEQKNVAAEIFKAQNHDAVNHPNHYCKGGVECLDAIKAALGDKYEGFLAGNVLKYVYRYPDKNGVEDCKKARFYLDKLIEVLSDEER
jgi:hypothetical protein